jgi:2-polyprenyl-3-methyl-5-hydroxy-6-metoxy-1,4-benzoquinol methylase
MPSRAYHEALWEQVPEALDPPDFELRRRFLLERVRAGQRVLDIGCGDGAFAAALAQAGVHVVAIDVASEPLRRAEVRHGGLELGLVEADAPWPLADESFDVLWAGETIEHVADTGGWLSEARRVLRPQGRLLLSTPDHGRLRLLFMALSQRAFARHFHPLADHLRFYTRGSLKELLQASGFQPVTVARAGGLPGARRVLLADAQRGPACGPPPC